MSTPSIVNGLAAAWLLARGRAEGLLLIPPGMETARHSFTAALVCLPLFVVLREGLVLDEALQQRLKTAIRTALSARHVPNEIVQVAAIPRTLSGKKMELPVKKLLLGADAAKVMNRDAMANADCVPWFVAYAERLRAKEKPAGA